MNLKRKTSNQQLRKILFLDPRCWKTAHELRLYYEEETGREYSWDWLISELLVDPGRGARILWEAHKRHKHKEVPRRHWPRGNRHEKSKNPNQTYRPGDSRRDWGPRAQNNDRMR